MGTVYIRYKARPMTLVIGVLGTLVFLCSLFFLFFNVELLSTNIYYANIVIYGILGIGNLYDFFKNYRKVYVELAEETVTVHERKNAKDVINIKDIRNIYNKGYANKDFIIRTEDKDHVIDLSKIRTIDSGSIFGYCGEKNIPIYY